MGLIDQHWKQLIGFQVGDVVRVEQEKEVYWKGEIHQIHTAGSMATVKMINPNAVGFNKLFIVYVRQLKLWDPADDVNI